MKNKEIQKGIRDIVDIKLTSDEKDDLFARLDGYVTDHPVSKTVKVSVWSGLFVHYRHSHVIALLVLCIFVGASVTFAAENALPGDVLYPVKIYVNESVKAVTKVTPKEKARFEEEKVIKRLDEVETLVKQGKFDDKKRTVVEREVEKSAKFISINKENKKEEERKDVSTTTDFEVKIDTRLDNLRKVKTKVDEIQNVEVEKFEIKIKDQLGNFNHKNDNSTDDNAKETNKVRGLFR